MYITNVVIFSVKSVYFEIKIVYYFLKNSRLSNYIGIIIIVYEQHIFYIPYIFLNILK